MENKGYDIRDFEKGLLETIDMKFLDSIRKSIPYINIYYLTCMTEIVNEIINEDIVLPTNHSLLEYINSKAVDLYKQSDISDYLHKFLN